MKKICGQYLRLILLGRNFLLSLAFLLSAHLLFGTATANASPDEFINLPLYSGGNVFAYYQLEADGYDSFSSNTYTLTPNYGAGGPTVETGLFGNGFGNSNNDTGGNYYTVATPPNIGPTDPFSISLWGNITQGPDNASAMPFYLGSATGNVGYYLSFSRTSGADELHFYRLTDAGSTGVHITDNAYVDGLYGAWHLYTITYDGSVGHLYVDGVDKGNFTSSATGGSAGYIATNIFVLGSFGTGQYTINGIIDDAVIFDTAISQANVDEIYGPTTPTLSPIIYWAGVGSQYGQVGGTWSVPFYWNICSDYGSVNDLYAVFKDGDTDNDEGDGLNLIQDKTVFTGPQLCSGISYWTGSVHEASPTTFNGNITLYTTSDGYIASSSAFSVVVNYGGSSANYLDASIVSPLHLNWGTGTTTIPFTYNFTGLPWSGGSVCIYNEVSNNYGNCVGVSAESGLSYMYFPDPTAPYTLNAHYTLYSSSSQNIIESDSFIINWWNTPVSNNPACQTPSVNYSTLCDGIASSTLGNIQCGIKYGFVSSGLWLFSPNCSSLQSLTNNFTVFKKSFPFNTFFEFTNTIESAIATTTTSTSATFKVPFVSSTGTIFMQSVISSSSIPNTIGAENNTLLRQTLTWLMWIIASCAVVAIIWFI